MAKELTPEEKAAKEEKKRLNEEKKQLKKEQSEAKKKAKARAKEIAKQEDELEDDSESGGFTTILATIFIVLLWLAVICVVVKLDVGGFGSSVLTPILKDVPVVNRILPGTEGSTMTTNPENYGGYGTLQEAVNQIYALEAQLNELQTGANAKQEQIDTLTAEVMRLREFENMQVEFQRIRTEFYQEVIYAENGPGADEYLKYYESMDPTTAEYLYKQVVAQLEADKEIKDYAAAYSAMKPKQAAAIFEGMNDSAGLQLAAKILDAMTAEERGNILGVMNSEVAAKITKIMDPDY